MHNVMFKKSGRTQNDHMASLPAAWLDMRANQLPNQKKKEVN